MKSLTLPVNIGATQWSTPNGARGSFLPTGAVTLWDPPGAARANPERFAVSDPMWSARLFVGLNVGPRPRWKVEDVVDRVAATREEQTGDPSASFVSQLGIYKHEEGGDVVTEKSVQVIILNLPDLRTPKKVFREQMVQLGEQLASDLQQELVIVELQRAGKIEETIGVSGKVQRRRRH